MTVLSLRRRRAVRVLAALVLGLPIADHAATQPAFERVLYFQPIESTQGLIQNPVNAIFTDRTGYLWFSTGGGLQQYDGYQIRTFRHFSEATGDADDGVHAALAEDPEGRIWCVTAGGNLARLDPRDGRILHVAPVGADGKAAGPVTSLLFDHHRGILAGTRAGILEIDPDSGRVRRVFPVADAHHLGSAVKAMTMSADGTVWAATAAGAARLAPGADAFTLAADAAPHAFDALLAAGDRTVWATAPDGLYRIDANGNATHAWSPEPDGSITAMTADARGRLWLAVDGERLAVFDPASGASTALQAGLPLPGSLPRARITTLAVDRSGLVWIGTAERGAFKVDPAGTPFRYLAMRENGADPVRGNDVRAIRETADGALWIGTAGDGLLRYAPGSGNFVAFRSELARASGLPADAAIEVNALADADNGQLWVATGQGVLRFDPATGKAAALPIDPTGSAGLPDPRVLSLLRTRDGMLWLGTAAGGLVRYDANQGTWRVVHVPRRGGGDANVLVMVENAIGSLWVGTDDGLALVDPASGAVRHFRHDPADSRSLAGNQVRALLLDHAGTLWIGTWAGLCRLDSLSTTTANFVHEIDSANLPNPTIDGILEDRGGRLWLSTNNGVVLYNRSDGQLRTFVASDGLQGMEFNLGAVERLDGGRFAFGGPNGLNLFEPDGIVASRFVAPTVITAVQVGAEPPMPVTMPGSLQMNVSDRLVRLAFAALDFADPSSNRFQYRLRGFDDRWVDSGTHHEATYTNLGSGTYTFEVRAANHDGYWSPEPTRLQLEVEPPWWDSLPARVLYALLMLAALGFWWRTWHAHRREEIRFREDLRVREDRLRMALWGSEDVFWDWNVPQDSHVLIRAQTTPDAQQKEPAPTRRWLRESVHPDDQPVLERRVDEHLMGTSPGIECECRVRNRDGEWTWVLIRGRIVSRSEDGQPVRVCGTARNVGASRAAEVDRRIAHEIVRSMNEALSVTDLEFRFLSINPAFTRMTGWRHDEVLGQSTALLNSPSHAPELYLAMRDAALRNGHWHGEMWLRRKDGSERLCWIELSEVRDASGTRTHFVSVLTDITERKQAEQELRYLANYDTLTGLPNRTLLADRLSQAIARAHRSHRKTAVLFLDLDRFKHVNDSMGHAVGDRMLKAAGNRLRQTVREGDTVARLGGDEFTVILEDITSSGEAEHVAQKIIAAFEQPLEIDDAPAVVISPSIGISYFPDHSDQPADLLKFADVAMYQAKERGRKTYMIYAEAMDAQARMRATMVSALGTALEKNEFSLVYQPKLSLLDNRVTGVEALLRWNGQDLGSISPADFIPVAEETGLIVQLGEWVVGEACATLVRWREAGVDDIVMSINVSVLQLLRGELTQTLSDIFAEYDVAPSQIELEITESMVMANAERSISTLRQLKAIGVKVSIDDFGTGYSSLSYLRRLPIDALKIDKTFVGDITTDPDDEAITATVITMAHSLGLNVIAEGVETAEQVEYLREKDCDEIQGYWLAAPMPAEQCLVFLRERALRRRLAIGAV